MSWLVRNVLPAQGLACIYGCSTGGKSFIALDLAAAVASGADWFGYRVRCSPVLYVALEGEEAFRKRLEAWQTYHGRVMPEGLHFVMQWFDLRDPKEVAELAGAIVATGGAGGLVIIDTLHRAAPGADENSSKDMGQIIGDEDAPDS